MSDNSKDLANKIKDLRLSKHLTMDMFVDKMNESFQVEISKGTVSKWEQGLNEPSLRLAKYLCLLYGISLDSLLGLDSNNDIEKAWELKEKYDQAKPKTQHMIDYLLDDAENEK
jgi:transcriptional regulator with XRE-family HTH domain